MVRFSRRRPREGSSHRIVDPADLPLKASDIELGKWLSQQQQQQKDNGDCFPRCRNLLAESAKTASNTDMASSSAESNGTPRHHRSTSYVYQTRLMIIMMIVLGTGASGIILALGVTAAKKDQEGEFARVANDLLQTFTICMNDYMTLALWLHQACHLAHERLKPAMFQSAYEYMNSTDLEFHSVMFAPLIATESQRRAAENDTAVFLQRNYPNLTYQGFTGMQVDANGTEYVALRDTQPFYYPLHFIAPAQEILDIDFDLYSSPVRRTAIDNALSTWQPHVTARLEAEELHRHDNDERYLQSNRSIYTETAPLSSYKVMVMHPGVPLSTETQPTDLAVVSILIDDVLNRLRATCASIAEPVAIYVHDATDLDNDPVFLGGARCMGRGRIVSLRELSLQRMRSSDVNHLTGNELQVGGRTWTFTVVAAQGTFKPKVAFVCFGAFLLLAMCIKTAIYIYCNMRRLDRMAQMRAQAEADKAQMNIENAKNALKLERDMNDFIAHEVRNPLSAAISACSFVGSAVNEREPLVTDEQRVSVREDVGIIATSLQFINELLRNMLDMHRAASNQLVIDLQTVDLRDDIFEPVSAMLYQRDEGFEVFIDCPPNLLVATDRLRLKQTVLNLGRNAAKFIEKGFVRLRAVPEQNNVLIYVEDSGPGVPQEKRHILFTKFQESLDTLNQGTGVGLCLCKKLVELMNGDIWLDEEYDSGVPGSPGARFVISLNSPAVQVSTHHDVLDAMEQKASTAGPLSVPIKMAEEQPEQIVKKVEKELPEHLTVLFVDDDMVLRKLFTRSVRKAAPTWNIKEAANGETSLRMAETETFDLIFMDQYMASVERQLLGTETVRALRSKGVESRICGLSANDMEKNFMMAGADAFLIKPFPCQKDALTEELLRILNCKPNKCVVFRDDCSNTVSDQISGNGEQLTDDKVARDGPLAAAIKQSPLPKPLFAQ